MGDVSAKSAKSASVMKWDAANVSLEKLRCDEHRFPDAFRISSRPIGKGSNNKAFVLNGEGGSKLILRAPRRRSDTQQWGSTLWEFRQTLRAAQLGVAPSIEDAWYAKHAKKPWTSGLFMIMEKFECDLEEAICSDDEMREVLAENDWKVGKEVAEKVVECVRLLSEELIFVYDLKPSNVVMKIDTEGDVHAKIVDFGNDFCEWDTRRGDPLCSTPIINGLRLIVERREKGRGDKKGDVESIVKHVLFASMMIQLSSTFTSSIREDRYKHKMNEEERRKANVFASYVDTLLSGMQKGNIALVRWVLRNDDVRGVLRHYHGRRNSGTGKTISLAKGIEK